MLSDHQFGFGSGRSTVDQLLLIYEEVSRYVDSDRLADVVLFDYSKAFDVVSIDLSERKSLIQERTDPRITRHQSLLISILCTMTSKALLKSKKMTSVTHPLSICLETQSYVRRS